MTRSHPNPVSGIAPHTALNIISQEYPVFGNLQACKDGSARTTGTDDGVRFTLAVVCTYIYIYLLQRLASVCLSFGMHGTTALQSTTRARAPCIGSISCRFVGVTLTFTLLAGCHHCTATVDPFALIVIRTGVFLLRNLIPKR